MKKFFVVIFLLFMALSARAEVVDRVVAVINGEIITLSELNAAAALAKGNIKGGPGPERSHEFKKKILENLIEEKLIKQAADRAGIDVSEREIDNAVEEIKKQNGFTQEALLLALANNGLTYREYRERLREQIRNVKFMNARFRSRITIAPEEIEEYYRRHIKEFYTPEKFRIRVIFIKGGDDERMKLKLGYITEALNSGEDFAALAKEYSDGPAASSGGDLGYLEKDELDSALEKEVEKLKPGEVSAPVKRPEGVYIIKLIDRRATSPKPFEKVRNKIYEKLYNNALNEKVANWLKEEKKVAHIDVRY